MMLNKGIFQPLPLLRTQSIFGLFIEGKSVIQKQNMYFKTLMLNNIVLMNSRIFIKASLWIHWFLDKIQKYVSCNVLLFESLVSIVDSIIMVIPNSYNFCSILLHFCVIWVFGHCLIIFELNMFNWLNAVFFRSQEWSKLICICCIASPNKQIRLIITYSFENVRSPIALAITRTPCYS